jgi:hypothetical protein
MLDPLWELNKFSSSATLKRMKCGPKSFLRPLWRKTAFCDRFGDQIFNTAALKLNKCGVPLT